MKNRIQPAIGVAISLLFLWLALRGVNPQELWQAVKHFNWFLSVPFVALTMLSMWVRTWRWRYILLPTADIPTHRLWNPLMAGFALNGLLPARLGEFARGYVLAKMDNLPFARVFATIVVERIFDMLILLGLLAYVFSNLEIDPVISYPYSSKGETSNQILALIALGIGFAGIAAGIVFKRKARVGTGEAARKMASMGNLLLYCGAGLSCIAPLLYYLLPASISYGSDYQINGASLKQLSTKVAVLSLVMLAGGLLIIWPPAGRFFKAVVNKLPLLPMGAKTILTKIIDTFAEGMQSLKSPKLILIVALQSLAVWMLVGWSMQIMTYGFEGMRAMTMTEATALLVITCLAILIPAAPGYWGLMELGIKFGMVILAVDNNPGRVMAYALLVHALQYFPITAAGLVGLWRSQVSMSEIQQERKAQ